MGQCLTTKTEDFNSRTTARSTVSCTHTHYASIPDVVESLTAPHPMQPTG